MTYSNKILQHKERWLQQDTGLKGNWKQFPNFISWCANSFVSHSVLVPPLLKKLHNSQINNKRHKCLRNTTEKDTTQRLKTSTKTINKNTTQFLRGWWSRLFSTSWAMRGIISLTAHQQSCSGADRRFWLFDVIVIIPENPCWHSHVDENTKTEEKRNWLS